LLSNHESKLLAAIIPDRRDLLDAALRHLVPEHFLDITLRNIYIVLERYAHVTGYVIGEEDFLSILDRDNVDAGKRALYHEIYIELWNKKVDEAEFRWALGEIRDVAAEKATHKALAEAMNVLTRGIELNGEQVKGHIPARAQLLQEFADIDRNLQMQDAPEGNLDTETDDLINEYANKELMRSKGQEDGILFGIPSLDAKIGGFQNGELDLIAGYSSDGKSSAVCQLAWHAAVMQGKNVVFFTTETIRVQTRRKIVARHSRHPMFELPEGLNTRDLKNGTLTPMQKDKYQDVVHDLTKNPTYGKFHIAQIPRGGTLNTLESKMYRLQRQFNVDLVVADYLALLRSERKRADERAEYNSILKESKQLATTFDDGRGVPFVSPWQVSRSARLEAEKVGYYTSSCLAETSEATNSSDVVLSVFAMDATERYADISMQILKNRDGETSGSMGMQVDYATCWFTERSDNASEAAMSNDPLAGITDALLGI
jgi:replicative DNA helicase